MKKIKTWIDEHLQGDLVIWIVILMLSSLSILVVYSSIGTLAYKHTLSTETYLLRHTLTVLLGLGVMWFAHKVDYRYYSKISQLALWISVPLLLYTYLRGVTMHEASRWIILPIINMSFQSSDFASLALIVNLASMLSKKQYNISDMRRSLMPILIWCGTICGLIALTNISTAILLLATCMLIMFIGRVPVRHLAMLLLVGILAGGIAFEFGTRGETAKNRIAGFIAGNELPFQAQHARIAIATGGILGKGPGNSDQRNILPHPYSDFIYAIVIEEYGIVGGIVLLILYLILLHRGMKVAYNSERAFGGLLAIGLSFDVVFQAMINMGVVVGLGPITGQPLPFLSMGGTSMIFNGLAMGMLLSVSCGEKDELWSKKEQRNILQGANLS